ncbi:MAG: hypothetical protein OXR66_07225 [Candidatus Woesearchaeota archaeon]|nr:hypothetical protein [Candidatus Woesearchaeota archaeon]
MTKMQSRKVEVFLACALLFIGVLFAQSAMSFSQGPNNRNVSVDTRVNITGSPPLPITFFIDDPVTLNAGGTAVVTCNVTVQDFNGFGDIDTVNGTLFSTTASFEDADENNTHYTDTDCAAIPFEQSGSVANYTCEFNVAFHALNGSWNCTVEANDTISLTGQGSVGTTFAEVLALNVTTLIDYGEMAVGEYSANQTANISNIGNVGINISVQGYGASIGDNLSFDCAQGNISIGLEKFDANGSADYDTKLNLSSTFQNVPGLTINRTDNATPYVNSTYWQLYLPPSLNAFGLCNGTVIFQAEASV